MRAPAALLVWLTLVTPPALRAEDPANTGGYGEIIEVRVVNVEVVVTDRKGRRVEGLVPKDFRLRVDGKDVPVSYFSEVREGTALAVESGDPRATAEPVLEGRAGNRFLVFIDDYFAVAEQRDRVLARLEQQFGVLAPEDRVAIAAFDGRRLTVLTEWTASVDALSKALEAAKKRPTFGLREAAERRSAQGLATIAEQAGLTDQAGVGAFIPTESRLVGPQKAYAEELQGRLRREINAVIGAMRIFSSSKERKVLVLLAGGWPYSPEEAVGANPVGYSEKELREGIGLYGPLVDSANLLGYTIYPVDLPGISTAVADAAAGPHPSGGRPVGPGGNTGEIAPSTAVGAPSVQALAENGLDGTLQLLAKETGGRATLNSGRDVAFERVVEDTRSYYWLGFSVDRKHDNRPHEIRVDLQRKELAARYRNGYRDLSRSVELSMRVENGLLMGRAASEHPLPVKIGEVKKIEQKGKELVEVSLLVGIPVDGVTVVPQGREYVVDVELQIGVAGASGATKLQKVPIQLKSERQPKAGGLMRYDTTLTLAPESHDVVLALLDPLTGKVLSSQFKIGRDAEPAGN